MIQQVPETLYDREAETEAFVTLASGNVELMEFSEDDLKLLLGDSESGIPDLDAQLVAASPAAEQDLTPLGVFHRVREQVPNHLLEEAPIAPNAQPARNHAPEKITHLRVVGEFDPHLLEQVIDRETSPFRSYDTGFDLVDVEESV
jgi:hypothetical protein